MKSSWQMLSLLVCGSVIVGCGETTSTNVADGTSAQPAAPAAAAPAAAPAPPADPLLEGLEFEDPQEFPKAKAAYESDSKTVANVQTYAELLLSMAWAHAQGGNIELSNQALSEAGQVVLKAQADGVALPTVPESTLQAEVLYGYACVLGRDRKSKDSLSALVKAVEAGFSNVQMLKNDPDLETVRALPEFESQMAAWEAHFAELQKRHEALLVENAKKDLSNAKGFDFDFSLTDVNGAPLNLADFKGRVCIVDIWGTWCPPCRQEVPLFVKLQDKYGKYGFQMIGLNDERGPSEEANIKTVKNFMANNSINYPCAMITKEVMDQLPEFQGFPTTLFIDHHGKVRLKAFGFHEYQYMEAVVETLLREQSRDARDAATN